MKKCVLALLIGALFISGCGSVVKSVKSPYLPDELTGTYSASIPYYLPKGKVVVSGNWNKDVRSWDITVKPVVDADPSVRYLVKRNVNVMFDDDITIAVDGSGLLQTANATSTDQTVNGIASLVSAAASALTFSAGLGPSSGGGGIQNVDKTAAEMKRKAFFSNFQIVLDPTKPSDIAYVQSTDPETNRLLGVFRAVLSSPSEFSRATTDVTDASFDGILVRRLIPYTLNVSAFVRYYTNDIVDAGGSFETPTQTILLPDTTRNYVVPLPRTPLVANSTKIALQNGAIQQQQMTRPSIFMGVVGIPKTILGALAPIPLQIKNDQLNLLNAESKIKAVEKELNSAP